VPVVFDTKDGVLVLEYLLKKNKILKGFQIFDDTALVTDKFIEVQSERIINTLDTKVKKVLLLLMSSIIYFFIAIHHKN